MVTTNYVLRLYCPMCGTRADVIFASETPLDKISDTTGVCSNSSCKAPFRVCMDFSLKPIQIEKQK